MGPTVLCIIVLIISIPQSVTAKSQKNTHYWYSDFLPPPTFKTTTRRRRSPPIENWIHHVRGGYSNHGEVSDSEQPWQTSADPISFNSHLDDYHTSSSTHSWEGWTTSDIHPDTSSSISSSLSSPSSSLSDSSFQTNTNESRIYPVSICSIQGRRQYMEDEYFTNNNGSFCSVMDGHGGSAVSKYTRQNLYARYLQAKATIKLPSWGNVKNKNQGIQNDSLDVDSTGARLDENSKQGQMNGLDQTNKDIDGAYSYGSNQSIRFHDATDYIDIQSCILALKTAFEKIDAEVQKISHWSYQGSTAVAVKLHKVSSSNRTVLISANVGDSRAVLCRAGTAIDLTRDHKPNDPEERKRIEGLGGRVEWFGRVDDNGQPLERRHRVGGGRVGSGGLCGVYRINRNLSLSRAIGDRSELPYVCSTVDISCIDLDQEKDRFIILATDGLWDVFESSQEVINVCQQIMNKKFRNTGLRHHHAQGANTMTGGGTSLEKARNKISKQLVREALKRGSLDNITVIIIWL